MDEICVGGLTKKLEYLQISAQADTKGVISSSLSSG
jgi:hypothetical protein